MKMARHRPNGELVSWMGIRLPVYHQDEEQFVPLRDLITTVAGVDKHGSQYKHPHFAFTYEVTYDKEQLYVLDKHRFRVYDSTVDIDVNELYIVQKHAYKFLLRLCIVTHMELSDVSAVRQVLPTLYNIFELEHRCLLHFNVVTTVVLPYNCASSRKYIEDSITECHILLRREKTKCTNLAVWLFQGVLSDDDFNVPEKEISPEERAQRAEDALLQELAEEEQKTENANKRKKLKAEKRRLQQIQAQQRQLERDQQKLIESEKEKRRCLEIERQTFEEECERQRQREVIVQPTPIRASIGDEITKLHTMEMNVRRDKYVNKSLESKQYHKELQALKTQVDSLRWQFYQISTQKATIRHQLEAAEYVLEHYYQSRGLNPDAEPFIIK